MTRDDIIRMAREAGMEHREHADEVNSEYCDGVHLDDLERFAALIAAAEREECAKVCEGITSTYHENDPRKCADAIRARGQA